MKLILLACMLLGISLTSGEENALRIFETGNERFTAHFMNEVATKNPGKNIIVSAYSVMFPLAQLSLAALGDTRTEILTVTGLTNNDATTKDAFKAAASSLESVKGVDLKMANKIYVTNTAELSPSFAQVSKDVFKSEVEKVNFAQSKATADAINQWVESKTNNRIKDLVKADSLDATTRVVLVNAIYFKGKWEIPFQVSNTKDRDFHVAKGKTQKVPMMYNKDYFLYAESEELDAKLLSLPYEGKQTSMLVVLPNEIDGIDALVSKLKNPEVLERAVASMRSFEVVVNIPKFKIETTTDLKELLQSLGIKKLFSNANLSNLLKDSGDLTVDSASQKAFIEVNEEGAEAAAANEFGIAFTSAIVNFDPPKVFNADQPFVFMIRKQKDTLFEGIIRE